MWFRRRRIVTHALALWALVVIAAALFAALLGYLATLSRVRNGAPVVPQKAEERLPTLLGTVKAVADDGTLAVETKQPFTSVLADEGTSIATLGGAKVAFSDLKPGMRVSATGRDIGGGRMRAEAIVIIAAGAPEAAATAVFPEDWSGWGTMPRVIGWGEDGSDVLAAVRGYDTAAPALSIELYGRDGKLMERIELDVPGYKRLKKLNPWLTPEEALKALSARGIRVGQEPAGSAAGWTFVEAEGGRAARFVKKSGE